MDTVATGQALQMPSARQRENPADVTLVDRAEGRKMLVPHRTVWG